MVRVKARGARARGWRREPEVSLESESSRESGRLGGRGGGRWLVGGAVAEHREDDVAAAARPFHHQRHLSVRQSRSTGAARPVSADEESYPLRRRRAGAPQG